MKKFKCFIGSILLAFTMGCIGSIIGITIAYGVPAAYHAFQDYRQTQLVAVIPFFVYNDCYHGATLSEVAENIRDLDYEVAAFFDSSGRKVAEVTAYDPNRVSVRAESLAYIRAADTYISIHNHPEPDATFSDTDIASSAEFGCRYAIVVSRASTYAMRFPEGSHIAEDKVRLFCLEHLELTQRIDGGVASTDELMLALAEEFGLKYYHYSADNDILEQFDTILAK